MISHANETNYIWLQIYYHTVLFFIFKTADVQMLKKIKNKLKKINNGQYWSSYVQWRNL